jgi:MYXO-CTERM domain-containing protein
MKRALAALLLLAATAAAPGAEAYCRTMTSRVRAQEGECPMYGVALSWRSACTSYSIYRANLPTGLTLPDLNRIAASSTGAWGRVACDDNGREPQYFRIVPDGTATNATSNPTGYNPYGPNSNTVSFRPKWEDDALHRPGTIAITVVTFDSLTGEIFDADIELNSRTAANAGGFVFAVGRVPEPDECDLQTILTHEFGHFLGLAHSNMTRAVMYPTAGLGEIRSDLNSDDSAGICAIYPERATPPGRCIGIPYGGLATTPGGARVVGTHNVSCAVGRGPSGRPSAAALALVALVAVASRRRRAT